MSNRKDALQNFRKAKATFEEKAVNATATEGIIDNAQELEREMVAVLLMSRDAGLTRESEELSLFWALSKLMAENAEAKVEERRWWEQLKVFGLRQPMKRAPQPSAIPPVIELPPAASSRQAPPTPLVTSQIPKSFHSLRPARSEADSTSPAPSPLDSNGSTSEVETSRAKGFAAAAARALDDVAPTQKSPRPTASGKSLESLGLAEKRVILTVKRKAREEKDELEDTDSEMEVDVPWKKGLPMKIGPPTKKQRITSKKYVDSDSEEEQEGEGGGKAKQAKSKKAAPEVVDGWRTFESLVSCVPCATSQGDCYSFVRRQQGRHRSACVRCHKLKKRCDLAETAKRVSRPTSRSRSRGSHKSAAMDEDEEDEEAVKAHKGKGKGKEKGKEKSRERRRASTAPMKDEDETAAEWNTIDRDEAGPSTGRIRRPREAPRDMAAVYTRIREIEAQAKDLEDATALRFGEVTQDLSRLDSNSETQKKYFTQQLAEVRDIAQTGVDRASGLQEQVDSVRQQTRDMHKSLQAMHRHSHELTAGLGSMMQRFEGLRFELPNIMDDWA